MPTYTQNVTTMIQLTELETMYDKRQSFYHKAMVNKYDNGDADLYSYGTPVAWIRGNTLTITTDEEYLTATTVRHIKEFALQNRFEADNKTQMVADYGQ